MSAAVAADWTMGGQDINNWRNQSSTGVHPQNVGRLKPKWVFTGNILWSYVAGSEVVAGPAIVGNSIYGAQATAVSDLVAATTSCSRSHSEVEAISDFNG